MNTISSINCRNCGSPEGDNCSYCGPRKPTKPKIEPKKKSKLTFSEILILIITPLVIAEPIIFIVRRYKKLHAEEQMYTEQLAKLKELDSKINKLKTQIIK